MYSHTGCLQFKSQVSLSDSVTVSVSPLCSADLVSVHIVIARTETSLQLTIQTAVKLKSHLVVLLLVMPSVTTVLSYELLD